MLVDQSSVASGRMDRNGVVMSCDQVPDFAVSLDQETKTNLLAKKEVL